MCLTFMLFQFAYNARSHINQCTVRKETFHLFSYFIFCNSKDMSTFSGFLDEIKNVSIDRFTQLNFQSKAFFLSHCHTDHMIGLNKINSENQLPLYLSEISKIQRRYPAIKNFVVLKIGGNSIVEKWKNISIQLLKFQR